MGAGLHQTANLLDPLARTLYTSNRGYLVVVLWATTLKRSWYCQWLCRPLGGVARVVFVLVQDSPWRLLALQNLMC